ncbi:MAG: response regulator transcription factor [Proteobacteria bacterium]|nr:MAG: response regulator transcription factor [Pseudomonadota bacterium]
MKRVLLLEDDQKLSELLTKAVQAEGMAVTTARSIADLEAELEAGGNFDALILDRLIHGADTRARLPDLKRRWPRAAVLIVSAINTPLERAELINAGADDYLGKPFVTQELLARLRSLLRRGGTAVESEYREIGNSVLNVLSRTFSAGENSIALPAKEFLVLKLLAEEPGRVIARNELLDSVWGSYAGADTNVVEATITNLRRRLSSIGSSAEIKNMRNSGYWLEG